MNGHIIAVCENAVSCTRWRVKIYDCELVKITRIIAKNNELYNLLREIVKDDKRGMLVHLDQHAALFMSYTLIYIRAVIFTNHCQKKRTFVSFTVLYLTYIFLCFVLGDLTLISYLGKRFTFLKLF